jgi:putative transposase
MRLMGIEAIYPKPRLSQGNPESKVYPYLLKDLVINQPDQVWATDITYIRMREGFVYLSAIMDWFSRYIITWGLAASLELAHSLEVLEHALSRGTPGIFNSDRGSQYTSPEHTGMLEAHGVRVSMDGRGRYLDNIFVERLWRSVKYEEVYLKEYESIKEARESLGAYVAFYNHERFHQSLGYKTPAAVYLTCPAAALAV